MYSVLNSVHVTGYYSVRRRNRCCQTIFAVEQTVTLVKLVIGWYILLSGSSALRGTRLPFLRDISRVFYAVFAANFAKNAKFRAELRDFFREKVTFVELFNAETTASQIKVQKQRFFEVSGNSCLQSSRNCRSLHTSAELGGKVVKDVCGSSSISESEEFVTQKNKVKTIRGNFAQNSRKEKKSQIRGNFANFATAKCGIPCYRTIIRFTLRD